MNYSKWRKPDSNVMGCKGSYIYVTFWKRWTIRTVIWLPGFQQEMEEERESAMEEGREIWIAVPLTTAMLVLELHLSIKWCLRLNSTFLLEAWMSLVLSPGRLSSLRSQEATYDRVFIFWKKKLIGLAFWSLNNKEGFELLGSLEG